MGKLFLWHAVILLIICKLNSECFPIMGSVINQILITMSVLAWIGLLWAIGEAKDREEEKEELIRTLRKDLNS